MTSTCHACRGDKLVNSVDELLIYIEKGIPNGHQYTYSDAADEFINVRPGNIVFKVETIPHSKFDRKGDNLHTKE